MSGNKKRVLILVNNAKPGVAEQAKGLQPFLCEKVDIVGSLSIGSDIKEVPAADLCIVLGGDGTLLSAARLLASHKIPLLGINLGKLGFLAEFSIEHMKKHLDEVLEGKVVPTKRIMLEVRVLSNSHLKFASPCANEVSISAGEPFRMIDLSVDQDEGPISRYVGDGLIISTPSGSTGYNMSAGGPILEPTLEAIAITPVASHSLSVRPIVIRSERKLRVSAAKVNPGTAVMIDGQLSSNLAMGDVVEVSRAPYDAMIIPHPGRDFFSTLTNKLQWGRSPHHVQGDTSTGI